MSDKEQAAWALVKIPLEHFVLKESPYADAGSLRDFWIDTVQE
jgi:hypothetical protein